MLAFKSIFLANTLESLVFYVVITELKFLHKLCNARKLLRESYYKILILV